MVSKCFFSSLVCLLVLWGCSSMPPPTAVSSGNDNRDFEVSVVASVAPASAVVNDSIPVGAMANFRVIDKRADTAKTRNPAKSITWYFYGVTTSNADSMSSGQGLSVGSHRYLRPEVITMRASISLLSGQSSASHKIYVVNEQSLLNQDSLLVIRQGTLISGQTNLYSVTNLVQMSNLSSGTNPWLAGPTDSLWIWANTTRLNNAAKVANGKFATITCNQKGGQYYFFGLGLEYNSADKNNSGWLPKEKIMYNEWYIDTLKLVNGDVVTHILGCYLGYNGTPYHVKAIPADSGADIVYGTYGDPYPSPNCRVRFKDNGALDSTIVYCFFDGLVDTTSAMTMNTNILGKEAITLAKIPNKKIGSVKLAATEIPSVGLICTYGRGGVVNTTFLSASTYWSTAKGAIWTIWGDVIGLNKRLSGSGSGLVAPGEKK
jgi:hypothetical protein